MEKVLIAISKIDLLTILSGVPIDLASLSDDKVQLLALLACHCILNGPVGVNKNTSFPSGQVGSIKTLLGLKVSNSSWRATCLQIAAQLVKIEAVQPVLLQCSQVRLNGAVWPLYSTT